MANYLQIKILTIKALILEAQANMVILPGSEGELGILPMHMPLLAELQPGTITIKYDGSESKYFVYGGIAEITGEYVRVFTDFATDLITASKHEILNEISKLESELQKDLDEHNIVAIRENLKKQKELLNHI